MLSNTFLLSYYSFLSDSDFSRLQKSFLFSQVVLSVLLGSFGFETNVAACFLNSQLFHFIKMFLSCSSLLSVIVARKKKFCSVLSCSDTNNL